MPARTAAFRHLARPVLLAALWLVDALLIALGLPLE